jgi:hypothetical protein
MLGKVILLGAGGFLTAGSFSSAGDAVIVVLAAVYGRLGGGSSFSACDRKKDGFYAFL